MHYSCPGSKDFIQANTKTGIALVNDHVKENIRKAEHRCDHLQEAAEFNRGKFPTITTPLRLEGLVFKEILFHRTVLLGFWFAKILK